MMIRFFLILIVLFIAVMVGLNLSHEPGLLTLSTQHWHFETSLWIAALVALISLFAFHLCCLSLRFLIKTPSALKHFFKTHQQYRSETLTHQALIEFGEGYWLAAKKHFIQALPHASFPTFNYVMAAYAASALGDTPLRDHYLDKAQQDEKAQLAVKLTQAQLQMAAQQWEAARVTLTQLYEIKPKHSLVFTLLTQCYEKTPQTLSLETITHFFHAAPKALQTNPRFLCFFIQCLQKHQAWHEANTLIKQTLRYQLDDRLIELYGELPVEEDKLNFINQLVKKHPTSASLHYCAGVLHFQSRLFGQAKLHFETSITIQPTPKAYFQLAQTLEALNLREEAYHILRKGLAQSILPVSSELTQPLA